VPIERDERPWGYFEVVDEGSGFRVKRIHVAAGQRLSYQRHAARSEHWYVVAGNGLAVLDGVEIALGPGDTVDIPAGSAHRASASNQAELVFIEIQTGSYFGEDDLERIEDDYGRNNPERSVS
jgi:mannose-6-phosphate isomerase